MFQLLVLVPLVRSINSKHRRPQTQAFEDTRAWTQACVRLCGQNPRSSSTGDNLPLVNMGACCCKTDLPCCWSLEPSGVSSDEVAGSSGVTGLTCMVGAAGLSTARVATLAKAGVRTHPRRSRRTPGQAGANINQSRRSCCRDARPICPSNWSNSCIRPLLDVVTQLDSCGTCAPRVRAVMW